MDGNITMYWLVTVSLYGLTDFSTTQPGEGIECNSRVKVGDSTNNACASVLDKVIPDRLCRLLDLGNCAVHCM